MYCSRSRLSTPVPWMWPSGSGEIHTFSQAGGILSARMRSSVSSSVISAPDGSCNNYVGSAAWWVMSETEPADVIGNDDSSFEDFVAGSSARLFTMARLLTGGHRAEAEDLLDGIHRRHRRHNR